MVKKVSSKTIDSLKYKNFIAVAENFVEAAKLAYEFEYYNASGRFVSEYAIEKGVGLSTAFRYGI